MTIYNLDNPTISIFME